MGLGIRFEENRCVKMLSLFPEKPEKQDANFALPFHGKGAPFSFLARTPISSFGILGAGGAKAVPFGMDMTRPPSISLGRPFPMSGPKAAFFAHFGLHFHGP